MAEAELPDGKVLDIAVARILTLTGVATGAAVVLFLLPVIRFSPDQVRVAAICGVVSGIAFTLFGQLQQRPRMDAIKRYLSRRAAGTLDHEQRRAAFDHAMNFPRLIVLTTLFGQWCAMGVLISGILYLSSETFSIQSALLTLCAAVAGGFISQVFTFTALRRRFAPIVATLSHELQDPAERESLIRRVTLRNKIQIVVVGMMITSAFYSASLAEGRSLRALETFATSQQSQVLDGVALPLLVDGEIATARRAVAPLGMQLMVLETDSDAQLDGSELGLLEEELAGMRRHGLDDGNSLGFEAPRAISWRRLDPHRVAVITTPLPAMLTESGYSWGYPALGMNELNRALSDVELRAGDAAELSAGVVDSSQHGRAQVQRTVESMRRIDASTRSLEQVIDGLGQRTSKIGTILGVIDGLADETGLLALNAAIISAQAGEHGKAFAVVAAGIKDLAGRVQQNTQEISTVLSAVQDETLNAIHAIEAGSESVGAGVGLAAESGAALEAIHSAALESGERSQGIVSAVRDQSQAAAGMSRLVGQVLAGVGEIHRIADTQSQQAGDAAGSTNTMGEVADQPHALTHSIAESTRQIAESMDQVHATSGEIDTSLHRQLEACETARASLEGLQAGVGRNESSVNRVENAALSLVREADDLRVGVDSFTLVSGEC